MSIQFAVFVHEPMTSTGWDEIDRNCTPDEAANLARSWGSRGWRLLILSVECIQEGWEMKWPVWESGR